jgi:CheY-like chemotaxis protein
MPQGSGLDAVPAVLRISPGTQVLVLTASDEKEEHVRAFKLGAKGVVLKDSARQTLIAGDPHGEHGSGLGGSPHDGRAGRGAVPSSAPTPAASVRGTRTGSRSASSKIVRLVASGYKNKEVGHQLTYQRANGQDTSHEHLSRSSACATASRLVMYALRARVDATD